MRPAAHASSFLVLSYFLSLPSLPAGDIGKIVFPEGMQTVNFNSCTGLTGTAEGCEVHILRLYVFAIQPQHVLPSSLYLFAFSSAGAVDKLVLPVGMQEVNFVWCKDLTGTAELGYE